MPGDLCTAPSTILLSLISLVNKRVWSDTRGKCPLARNPDRSWWHRHVSLKLFWPQPMAPWTTGWYWDLNRLLLKLILNNSIFPKTFRLSWKTVFVFILASFSLRWLTGRTIFGKLIRYYDNSFYLKAMKLFTGIWKCIIFIMYFKSNLIHKEGSYIGFYFSNTSWNCAHFSICSLEYGTWNFITINHVNTTLFSACFLPLLVDC